MKLSFVDYQTLLGALQSIGRNCVPAEAFCNLYLFRPHIKQTTTAAERIDLLRNFLKQAVQEADGIKPFGRTIINKHYLDQPAQIVDQIAAEHQIDRNTINREQKAAVQTLADHLNGRELALRQQMADEILLPLGPRQWSRVIGFETDKKRLIAALLDKKKPHDVISVTGIGGIGKTTLADWGIRTAAPALRYERVGKIMFENGRATKEDLLQKLADAILQGESLPAAKYRAAIRRALKNTPHLFLLDNFESDFSHLIDLLSDLSAPSRFVVTGRHRPDHPHHLQSIHLDGLPFADAADLIRHYAQEGTPAAPLRHAGDEDLRPIYDKVGGNPQALQIVAKLARRYSIEMVLTELGTAGQADIKKMYQKIYQTAWNSLEEDAQFVLEQFPFFNPVGETPADIVAQIQMTEEPLAATAVHDALAELDNRSLVNKLGHAFDEILYTIHPLTRSFIVNHIYGGWSDES